MYDPEGNLLYTAGPQTPPCLSIATAGFHTELEYGENRENWIIMLNTDALVYHADSRSFLLNYHDTLLPLPDHVNIDPSEIPLLRNQFQTIKDHFLSAIPARVMEAEIMAMSLFRYFIKTDQVIVNDPAEQFRLRLDQDEQWNMTLAEHCQSLGIGRDTMRRIFFERYKISPNEYRTTKRLQKIINLFVYSDMTLKEIAFAVGMKNVTHLNSLLQQHYGKTPSTLCREYRHSKYVKDLT